MITGTTEKYSLLLLNFWTEKSKPESKATFNDALLLNYPFLPY